MAELLQVLPGRTLCHHIILRAIINIRIMNMGPIVIGFAILVGIALIAICVSKRHYRSAVLLAALLLIATAVVYGTVVRMHVRTGDLALTVFGVRFFVYPMENESRSALLSLPNKMDADVWIPVSLTDGSDARLRSYYRKAAAWSKTDLEMAAIVIRDIQDYSISTNGSSGLPRCINVISPDVVAWDGRSYRVVTGWSEHPDVINYRRLIKGRGRSVQ